MKLFKLNLIETLIFYLLKKKSFKVKHDSVYKKIELKPKMIS